MFKLYYAKATEKNSFESVSDSSNNYDGFELVKVNFPVEHGERIFVQKMVNGANYYKEYTVYSEYGMTKEDYWKKYEQTKIYSLSNDAPLSESVKNLKFDIKNYVISF